MISDDSLEANAKYFVVILMLLSLLAWGLACAGYYSLSMAIFFLLCAMNIVALACISDTVWAYTRGEKEAQHSV